MTVRYEHNYLLNQYVSIIIQDNTTISTRLSDSFGVHFTLGLLIMNAPEVRKGQWIIIGTENLNGYVIDIHSDGSLGVSYYQNQTKAIKDDVVWNGTHWKFKYKGPHGSYLQGQEEAIVKRGPYGY